MQKISEATPSNSPWKGEENWRFIPYKSEDGYFQMATDETLFQECKEGKFDGVLRFYDFSKPTYTLGFFQKIHEFYKTKKDQARDVVRRITGGGLVDHEKSLTFSFITHEKTRRDFSGINALYKRLHQIIQKAFQKHDIALELKEKVLPEKSKFQKCFEEPVISDLVFKESKVVGGAQKRSRGYILHQGSIYLGFQDKEKISELRGDIIPLIAEGFEESFRLQFSEEDLTDEEYATVSDLSDTKYKSESWKEKF